MWKWIISTIYWISNKASIFLFKDMKYQKPCCNGHGSVTENNEQPFKFIASNSALKAQFHKGPWNRKYRNGHNMDDLVDFDPITINSWFIMATSRYDCASLNPNCFGIGPNSALSVRLCPLCHGGSSERLLKWVIGAQLETANLKYCPMFMITVPWPLHELLWYFTSLQTNILTLLQIKKLSKFYISYFVPFGSK